jgi:hypothetical protein
MHRGNDNLPGGDFIDHIRIQCLNSCQHRFASQCGENISHSYPALLI